MNSTSGWSRRQTIAVLRFLLILAIVVVSLYPIYWFAMISLKTQRQAFKVPPDFIFVPTLQNYSQLFGGEVPFGQYFLNSVIISFVSTGIALFAGITAAYALSRAKFRGRNTILFAVLGSRMVPPMLFVIPYYLVFTRMGLIDTRIGLIVVFLQFNLTLAVWSMRAFFDDIPVTLEESAFIDGATDFQAFSRIVLPLAGPGVAATTILCLMLSWNNFVYPMLLSQMKAMTAPVAVVIFASQEIASWGVVAAGAIVMTVPVVIFVFLIKRYLVAGLMGGAIKE